MAITVKPLTETLGAEVGGVDASGVPDAATAEAIRDAFHTYKVLVFPKQDITPEQHIAFSRAFGDLVPHPNEKTRLSGYPDILLLTNERHPDGTRLSIADGGQGWHSDLSYMAEPSLGSLLYAVRTPSDPEQAQNTIWQDLEAAYDTLPDATKHRIAGLKAAHIFDQDQNPRMPPIDTRYRDKHTPALRAKTPPRTHPIVRTHPATGRKALFVSIRFTVAVADLPQAEGDALLDDLFMHLGKSRYTYKHVWSVGDLVMWDNRCTNHRALGDIPEAPHVRRLHRTTLKGDAVV